MQGPGELDVGVEDIELCQQFRAHVNIGHGHGKHLDNCPVMPDHPHEIETVPEPNPVVTFMVSCDPVAADKPLQE